MISAKMKHTFDNTFSWMWLKHWINWMKTLFLNKQLNENRKQRRTNERQNFSFGYMKLIDLFEKVIICNWKNVVKATTNCITAYNNIEYYC